MEITNLEKPKTSNEYGVFNLKGMPNVFYRYDLIDAEAFLMEDFFADNQPEEEKYKKLPKDSKMYQSIQELLTEYLENDV